MTFATGQLGRVRGCLECGTLLDDEVDGRRAYCGAACEEIRRSRGSENTERYVRHQRVRARRAAMIERKKENNSQ